MTEVTAAITRLRLMRGKIPAKFRVRHKSEHARSNLPMLEPLYDLLSPRLIMNNAQQESSAQG